jgi:ATP-dependent Lon protease
VLIPKDNERDLEEIPDNVKQDLDIHPVQWIEEVLLLALAENPEKFTPANVKKVKK